MEKTESDQEEINILIEHSKEHAVFSYGYSYIFKNRASFYERWSRILTLLGVIVPLIIGSIALNYGSENLMLSYVMSIAIPLSIVQVMMSCIALVNKWEDRLSYSYEAVADYNLMSEEFRKISKYQGRDLQMLQGRMELLENNYSNRSTSDIKHSVSDREKRVAMRWSLREFQYKCVGCGTIPLSMDSTNCSICGDFKQNLFTKIFKHG